jgi:RNA polymerase sigma-70 factor (ECF subfamily)
VALPALAWEWIRTHEGVISREQQRTAELNDLVARVAVGDREAFEGLYDLIAGPVLGTVRRIVRNHAIAEEVAHDALMEVWTKAADWNADRGSAAVWILTISRRRAIDRVRSEQASRDRADRVGTASMDRDHDQVSDADVIHDEHSRISAGLSKLSPIQREAIGLAFYEGHTQREIAGILELPLGTVKTRIRDGLIALRSQFGDVT